LAGNVYDYGAQAFIKKHDKGVLNQFSQALDAIEGILSLSNYKSVHIFKISLGL
jgi:hypothetical protein